MIHFVYTFRFFIAFILFYFLSLYGNYKISRGKRRRHDDPEGWTGRELLCL